MTGHQIPDSVLYAVDGYGFGMVVDVMENPISPDAETIPFLVQAKAQRGD